MRRSARQDAGIPPHVGQDYHFSSENPGKAAITSAVLLVCFTRHRSEFALLPEEEREQRKYKEGEREKERKKNTEEEVEIETFPHIAIRERLLAVSLILG